MLLLDEPTNHLDLDAVMWLEDYICSCKSTVIIVSHAREFLNVTCNEIIHFFNEKLDYYRGNYDIFEKIRIENRERNRKQVENQQMKLEHMQAFIDKFRYSPSHPGSTPSGPLWCSPGSRPSARWNSWKKSSRTPVACSSSPVPTS